ncbi:MAG: TetR/AcrR family transcriptional regulator [Roseiflexaceae bacterium]
MPSHLPAEPIPKRRERSDARENRQQLLAVAKQLFTTQGIDSTSMHEIGRTAGVGQATLYRHFADKGEICLALIKEDLADVRERVGALMIDAQTSPLARLELLIVEKIGVTEGHLPLLAAMQDAAAGSRRPQSFRGPFDTWVHEHVVALLEQAVVQSEVAALDILFTADAILAALAPRHYRYQRYDLGYSSERIIAGMCHLFIERLRRRSTD